MREVIYIKIRTIEQIYISNYIETNVYTVYTMFNFNLNVSSLHNLANTSVRT